VVAVQTTKSNALRGNAIEEISVILLRFANGVLGTVTVSETIAAPWSSEPTRGEGPAYTDTLQSCSRRDGMRSSVTIHCIDLQRNETASSWWKPIEYERLPVGANDPLERQVQNLRDEIRGGAQPLVSGSVELRRLTVIAAVTQAGETGGTVDVV
jgi:predicted dehydrogenase